MYMHIEYLETKTLRVRKKVNTAQTRFVIYCLIFSFKKKNID